MVQLCDVSQDDDVPVNNRKDNLIIEKPVTTTETVIVTNNY